MILGPSYETVDAQHKYCLEGADSWCKYQKGKSNCTTTYNRSKCLPFIFRGELRPMFDKSDKILSACERGLTQNQNESINGILWSK